MPIVETVSYAPCINVVLNGYRLNIWTREKKTGNFDGIVKLALFQVINKFLSPVLKVEVSPFELNGKNRKIYSK